MEGPFDGVKMDGALLQVPTPYENPVCARQGSAMPYLIGKYIR